MNTEQNQAPASERPSFLQLWQDVRNHRRLYYIILPVAFVLAAVYALAIPNYYSCTVKLSPELSSSRTSSSLASLASSFGFNLGSGSAGMGSEALFPTLYPELVNSISFKTSLFQVPVTIEGDKKKGTRDRTMPYYDYLSKEQKKPWFSAILGAPAKLISLMFNGQSSMVNDSKVNPFRLTKKQAKIVKALNKKIVCDVDKKTMVITIEVTDQNPVICATMADSVKEHLQRFITEYRTKKARVDLAHNQKLFDEARERYEQARKDYARRADANRNVLFQGAQTEITKYQNELNIQYTAYSQIAAQLRMAEAKVQEETPAFTTLQPATVPIRKAGPARAKMCLAFVFLAFIGTTAWIIHREGHLLPFFTGGDEEEPQAPDQTALIQALLSLSQKKADV